MAVPPVYNIILLCGAMAVSLRFAGNVRRVDAAVDVADGRTGIIIYNIIMSSADGFARACVGGTC